MTKMNGGPSLYASNADEVMTKNKSTFVANNLSTDRLSTMSKNQTKAGADALFKTELQPIREKNR